MLAPTRVGFASGTTLDQTALNCNTKKLLVSKQFLLRYAGKLLSNFV